MRLEGYEASIPPGELGAVFCPLSSGVCPLSLVEDPPLPLDGGGLE